MTRRYLTLAALLIGPFIGAGRGRTDGVQVTPSSGTIDVPPYAQAQTQVFQVTNTGTRTVDFSIQAADCQPFELNCAWSTFSLNGVGPNQSVPLTVTFTSGAPGWSGTISFVAKVNDNQSVAAAASVTVRVPAQARVETKSLNPGTTIERSRCVSFPVATNSFYQCGDLVIAHALPSLRVRGDDRTPVLLYNTAHAEPHPVVLANVSLPPAGATNVTAALSVRRGTRDVQVVSPIGIGFSPGDSTGRIALGYDASTDTTGVYPYTLTVTMTVAGSPQTLTASDTLVVVNRGASPFGAGWWLAGYERLVRLPGGGFLWVGGDGSTRRYVRDTTRADEAYGAAGFDRPDSLVFDGTVYVRKLRHGARVEFDANGRHVATKDPLGFATTFDNDPTSGRLRAITHPGTAQQHLFFYSGGGSPLLDSVTAPGGTAGAPRRKVALTHAQRGKVTRITDADGRFVGFAYFTTSSVVVTSRTNRNNVQQTFDFIANRLTTVGVPLNAAETATTTVCPAEIQGLAPSGCGNVAPLPLAEAVTRVNGPRTDVGDTTRIQTDRFGAPAVVTDAAGNSTRLYRGNRAFPGLVTRVVNKNGWVNDAFYNANGLIGALVEYAPLGPGADAVTSFQWDPKWERVTQITLPERNVLRFGYDSVTGNRIWQEDGRGAPSRVNFRYYTSGGGDRLLRAAEYPAQISGDRDSVEYDTNGNIAHIRQVSGNLVWTARHFTSDPAGRPTSSCTDIDIAGNGGQQCQFHAYDIMDRDSVVTDSGPPTTVNGMPNTPAQAVRVRSFYDAEGNLDSLKRSPTSSGVSDGVGTLTTRWTYDLANRRVKEIAPDGAADSLVFDAAGNTTRVLSRRHDPANPATRLAIDMTYDALNRLTRRVLPPVNYPLRNQGIPTAATSNDPDSLSRATYPRLLRNASNGLTIAADTETFTYDEMGAIRTANNGDARVTRTYYANGLIQAETLKVRNYADSGFSNHVYVTGYEYDLNGRRAGLTYPVQLTTTAGGTYNRARYAYDPATGALATVTDLQNNVFTFAYDAQTRVDSIAMPGRIVQRFGYDGASRLINDIILNRDSTTADHFPKTLLRETALGYNSRGDLLKTANAVGKRDTLVAAYYGLGYLAASDFSEYTPTISGNTVRGSSSEGFSRDALASDTLARTAITNAASQFFERTVGRRNTRYQAGTERQVRVRHIDPGNVLERADSLLYDEAGDVVFSWTDSVVHTKQLVREDRAMYYSADGKLRVVDHRTGNVGPSTDPFMPIVFDFDEHRYDALGRRVLSRTQRACVINLDFVVCGLSTVRRTVWDGTQELAEIQQPGGTGVSNATLENDTAFAARLPIYRPGGVNADLNQYYGRVAYTLGPSLDHPLSVTRWGYQADSAGQFAQWPEPFTLVPHWNVRGGPDNGAFADGSTRHCGSTIPSMCLRVSWPFGWTAYEQKFFQPPAWNGTLLEEKRDGSGLLFKRNRYLDPVTGKFTQEDPIGLAGGLSLYGFAAGDPVNYSDPFGLCPPKTMAEVLLCTGQLLQPAQGPLELAGSLAILPLSGGGFAAEGISAEVLALGQTLRSGAGSGILTAAGVAQRVAGATGGAVEPLAKSEGFKVTVMQGRRAIVTRIKSTGEMRVNVAGKGGMTSAGELSEDRALTHLQNLSSQQLTALVERARELLQAMRR